MKKRTKEEKIFAVCNGIILTAVVILCFYPVYYVLISSVSDASALAAYTGIRYKPVGFSIYKNELQIEFSREITDVLEEEKRGGTNASYLFYHLQKSLKQYVAYNDYIQDIGVVFDRSGYVITSKSAYKGKLQEEFLRQYRIAGEDWDSLAEIEDRGFYILDAGGGKSQLVYVAPLHYGPSAGMKGRILIFPEEKYLAQKLHVKESDHDRAVFLIEQDAFISLTGSQSRLEKEKKENEMRWVLDSETSNLQYMITDQYHTMYRELRIMHWLVMASMVISTILGMWCVFYFSRRNYKPVKNLVLAVSGKAGEQKGQDVNEYMFLQNTMTKAIDSQEKAEQHMALLKLLRGYPVPERIKGSLFTSDVYGTVVFAIEDTADFFDGENLASDSYRLLSFVVSNCVKDFFEDAHTVFDLVDADHYLIQVIGFSGKNKEEHKEALWKKLHSIHEFFNSRLKIRLSVSMGSLFEEAEGLADSYEQAREAMEYRMMMGSNVVIDFESLTELSLFYDYSLESERDIINSLKNGNYEQARDFMFQVIDSNINSGMMSAQLARCMLFDLVGTIIKGLSLTRLDSAFLGRLNPVERLLQCETFDRMKCELSDILRRVCDYINDNREDPNRRQFEKAVAYIGDHYMDENLSVSSLAEGVFVSKSFLVKLFKDHAGLTPLDYMNRFRCEQALALLECSEYTIEEVARKAGYSNAHTFIRIFKKLYGKTPGMYRSERG